MSESELKVAALMADPLPPDPIPPEVRAAIHRGHVAAVVVFCDDCGTEHCGDYIGATSAERIGAARTWLRDQHRWLIRPGEDLCPDCAARACVHAAWQADDQAENDWTGVWE